MLNYGAALIVTTGLNKGLPNLVFGVILCFVNIVVIGLAAAMGAYRNEQERKKQQWRQVMAAHLWNLVLPTSLLEFYFPNYSFPFSQQLTPGQLALVMNVMHGADETIMDTWSKKNEPAAERAQVKHKREKTIEELLRQVLLNPKDVIISAKVHSCSFQKRLFLRFL